MERNAFEASIVEIYGFYAANRVLKSESNFTSLMKQLQKFGNFPLKSNTVSKILEV